MNLIISRGDLFTLSDTHYLAQCISSDFELGAGIALEFDNKFNIRNQLFDIYPNGYIDTDDNYVGCIQTGNVLNLVTKRLYYNKPTLSSFRKACIQMADIIEINGIQKIATYKLGCCRDKLKWKDVKFILEETLGHLDIEVVIRYE